LVNCLRDSGLMGGNMSQTALLADQIRRAFEGEAWHGDAVLKILKGVSAAQAAARPIKNAHSIWEIVGHIAAWDGAVLKRTGGKAAKVSGKDNFPAVKDAREAAWREAIEHLTEVHRKLVEAVSRFPDARLREQVPGKRASYYNYYYMFSGIVQHELYHAGQIAILKKAL
jgi:uncharacterized damage-inducible protein DinB